MTYYWPPYPPHAPIKRRTNVGLIIGVVAAAVLGCCGLSFIGAVVLSSDLETTNGRDLETTNGRDVKTTSGDGDGDNSQAFAMNQPARDGKFEFVVTSVECGVRQLGGGFLTHQAQGQFCLVHLTVRNIGNVPQMFSAGNQRAYNAAGQRYDADASAALYIEDSRAFLEDINPGNAVDATLVFDIPPDAAISALELHDSLFSDGVTITVG